jgi:hypothetical protein
MAIHHERSPLGIMQDILPELVQDLLTMAERGKGLGGARSTDPRWAPSRIHTGASRSMVGGIALATAAEVPKSVGSLDRLGHAFGSATRGIGNAARSA